MAAYHNMIDKLSIPAEEAYKVLRTNIQFSGFDKDNRVIAVTSCNPGEGKTTTAVNLSISLAMVGLKVLFVDADLRKPMLMKHLGRDSDSGLSNLIAGFKTLEEVIQKTNVENFYFIPCGPKPPNPAELISSVSFTDFIDDARNRFDMVIIDTPPLGSVIDCAAISVKADGTLIVIQPNKIEYKRAVQLKEQLEKVDAKILGVILNKVKKNTFRSYYNHYNYYANEGKINKTWFKNKKNSRKVWI